MTFTTDTSISSFGGKLLKLSHDSPVTGTKMVVNIYLPHQYFDDETTKLPVLMYLSGLTCTPDNASEKAFFQPYANQYGFAVVFPDTSPRGANIEGEDDSWDFGTGAGFYLDATQKPWNKNYKMYSYIMKDLIPQIASSYDTLDTHKMSICGHSMGGYGALMFYLRNPDVFQSCSAFAPITNPSECQWGKKSFSNYLGDDKTLWAEYDPCDLVKKFTGDKRPILIHQGTADAFYAKDHQLQPEKLVNASTQSPLNGMIDLHLVDGYDHSYYFISSFVKEHCQFHAKYLGLN
ncbi:hypothetical protein FOA43_001098 [Brettanomyces nanus]|uniref:S-formylglutathione hydrolase n=1 Tax=Eeniella nana TaxID=13502 RepID=A0A875S390_EENNA|nr:uncharacterized protein FOA43_001098 [Brettanomyces nanus]QPG73784.1 hypothetical protein FOA43_001098 [Brettanomyces nanus]